MKRYYYKKRKKIATDYFEIPYVEYREDGSIKAQGTEDFSRERMIKLGSWFVKTPNGKLNKGGHRMWDYIDHIYALNAKEATKIATILYPNKELKLIRL